MTSKWTLVIGLLGVVRNQSSACDPFHHRCTMSMSFHFFIIVLFSLSWSFLTFQVPCPELLLTWDLVKFFRLSTSSNIHNRVVCVPLCVHVCVSVLYICMFCVLCVLLLPLFFQRRMLIPRGLKLFIQSHTENLRCQLQLIPHGQPG